MESRYKRSWLGRWTSEKPWKKSVVVLMVVLLLLNSLFFRAFDLPKLARGGLPKDRSSQAQTFTMEEFSPEDFEDEGLELRGMDVSEADVFKKLTGK